MLLFVLLLLFVLISALVGFVLTRVPFVPTSQKDIALIVQKVPITNTDVFYDLGSGDGKVVFGVEKLSGAKVKGFEMTLWTHLWAKVKKIFLRSHAELSNQNFFKQNWVEATVIYGYLYPPLMKRVEEKFRTDCRPGTMVVIRDFPLPTLKPVEVINPPPQDYHPAADSKWNRLKILLKSFWKAGKLMNHEIYIYRLTDVDKLNL